MTANDSPRAPSLPPATAFWDSDRPELVALRWEARRRIASPWALLAIALTRALLTIPHPVRYRSALRPEGSPINLAVGLVGRSGAGKSTAVSAAETAVHWIGEDVPESTMVRSGEGIPALLGYMSADKGSDGDPALAWRRHDRAAWLHWDEVGQLGAQGARSGSTVLDSIKSLTSGERLGGQNSRGDGLSIPPGSYRAVVTIAVQPRRAEPLLNESAVAGGLTARFLWFSTEDAEAADAMRPGAETDAVAVPLDQWDSVRYVDALPEMDAAHEADQRAAMRGERDPEDSRRVLNRAFIAIALANMAGRSVLTSEDWHLAGAVLRHSDDTLADMRAEALAPDPSELRAEAAQEDRIVAKVAEVRATGAAWGYVKRALTRGDRPVLDQMVREGLVIKW